MEQEQEGEEKKERLGEKSLEGDLQVPRQEEGRCRKGECLLVKGSIIQRITETN